jgi:hypothetical protein
LADAPELLRVRVLPAEFARLMGVSKQTVSRWIGESKMTVNHLDGRLDVQTAVQQVPRNTDPGRMRARVLRVAIGDVQQLRAAAAMADERVEAVKAELAEARAGLAHFRRYAEDADCACGALESLLRQREADLRATEDSGAWNVLIGELVAEANDVCDSTHAPHEAFYGRRRGGDDADLDVLMDELYDELASLPNPDDDTAGGAC